MFRVGCSRTVLRAAVVLAGVVCALPTGMAGAAEPAGARAGEPGVEIEALRTERSVTYEKADGTRVLRSFNAPVSFRDGDRWRAIDPLLVASPRSRFAWRNKADAYTVDLPASIDDAPVSVRGHDGARFDFKLADAEDDASGRRDGATATYRDALPGVSLNYTAGPGSLKEEIVLEGPDAPSTFDFDVSLSEGLTLEKAPNGGLLARAQTGEVAFSVAPPYMYDQQGVSRGRSNAVTYDLTRKAEGAYRLTVRADREWLSSPTRSWPVTVDPTVTLGAATDDCFIQGGYGTNVNNCGQNFLDVGWDGGAWSLGGTPHRALMKFDVASALPAGAVLTGAELVAYTFGEYSTTPANIGLYRMTAPWTAAATYRTSNGSTPWAQLGGDHDPAAVSVHSDVAGEGEFFCWDATSLVQKWVDGSAANHGLMLRAQSESGTSNTIKTFASRNNTWTEVLPRLDVEYRPVMGEDGPFTFVNDELSQIRSGVNVATGRLTVRDTDSNESSDDVAFSLERHYNSNEEECCSPLGPGWKLAAAVTLRLDGNQNASVQMPSGTWLRFPYDPASQMYAQDSYQHATLTKSASHYILERRDRREKFFFSVSTGRLTARETADEAGQITYAYNSAGRLSTITTPEGKVATLTYDGSGQLIGATQTGEQSVTYGYANGRLAYRTKGGDTASYNYTNGRLTQITSPAGKVTFEYDTSGRVKRVVRVTDLASNTGPTTTFDYSRPPAGVCGATSGAIGSTGVTSPSGERVDYCWDGRAAVRRSLSSSGAGAPALALTGPLYAARSTLLAAGTYALTAQATGATSVELHVDGQLEQQLPSESATWTLDTADFAAGRHTIGIKVIDSAGRWTVESFTVVTPDLPEGDGTVPGEGQPIDPSLEADLTAAACVNHYGAGSSSCDDQPEMSALAASAQDLLYGIADDDVRADQGLAVSYLADQRFQELQIKRVRRLLPWNIMRTPNRLAAFQRFYDQATANGVDIIVSFQFDCPDGSAAPTPPNCYREGLGESGSEPLPDWRDYVGAIRDFKSRFVKIRFLSPWNEPNHPRQPFHRTNTGPKAFAKYTYYVEKYVCAPRRRAGGQCDVLAGEVYPRLGRSETTYLRTYKRQLDALFSLQGASGLRYPSRWAYHPYTDLKKYKAGPGKSVTREYLRIIGNSRTLWFTEVGAYTQKGTEIQNSEAEQAAQVRYLYDDLAAYAARIDRVYYYHFCEGANDHDSGLLGRRPAGAPATASCGGATRSSHTVLKNRSVKDSAPAN